LEILSRTNERSIHMKRIFAAAVFIVSLSIASINTFAQAESRDDLLKQLETKRAELTALEKKFLEPSEQDSVANAGLLGQSGTGLIRLLPREVYDKDTTLTIHGGGSYYSFTRLTHAYGYGSDIALERNFLKVGFAGADYGMLINVGDVPLAEISSEHPSVRFLANYTAVPDEPKARIEQRRFGGGTSIDGITYSETARAQVKTTYVLRSINYSDSDVLVAFRVIRKDTDGSLIIAWKMLKEYPVTDLVRNKTEQ
jgi:hypothetical protein